MWSMLMTQFLTVLVLIEEQPKDVVLSDSK